MWIRGLQRRSHDVVVNPTASAGLATAITLATTLAASTSQPIYFRLLHSLCSSRATVCLFMLVVLVCIVVCSRRAAATASLLCSSNGANVIAKMGGEEGPSTLNAGLRAHPGSGRGEATLHRGLEMAGSGERGMNRRDLMVLYYNDSAKRNRREECYTITLPASSHLNIPKQHFSSAGVGGPPVAITGTGAGTGGGSGEWCCGGACDAKAGVAAGGAVYRGRG